MQIRINVFEQALAKLPAFLCTSENVSRAVKESQLPKVAIAFLSSKRRRRERRISERIGPELLVTPIIEDEADIREVALFTLELVAR